MQLALSARSIDEDRPLDCHRRRQVFNVGYADIREKLGAKGSPGAKEFRLNPIKKIMLGILEILEMLSISRIFTGYMLQHIHGGAAYVDCAIVLSAEFRKTRDRERMSTLTLMLPTSGAAPDDSNDFYARPKTAAAHAVIMQRRSGCTT
jgi:hypothetical protein